MEHFQNIEKRKGCNLKHGNDLHPENKERRIGKFGFDKTSKLNEMLEIAYKMENPRPNIIIKAGKNAKWYLKYCMVNKIEEEITKNKATNEGTGGNRCTMYIITWE
jgi:hypothetical protein